MKKEEIFPENFIKELKELLFSFGLNAEDWCMHGEYALLLNGYDIMEREKHLDIFVRSKNLKWQIRDQIQTIPPKNSELLDIYCDFIDKYKFGLHLIPIPKRKVDFNWVLKNSHLKLLDEDNVLVMTTIGYVKDILITLSSWEKHEFGERLNRWKGYLLKIKSQAEKKIDLEVIKECDYILKKFYREES